MINGVPLRLRLVYKVQTGLFFFLGNIRKCVQGSFGLTLEPVAMSIRGGVAKLLSGAGLTASALQYPPECDVCETLRNTVRQWELFQPNARDPMF